MSSLLANYKDLGHVTGFLSLKSSLCQLFIYPPINHPFKVNSSNYNVLCTGIRDRIKGPGFAYAHGKETRNHANGRRPVNGLDRRKPSN